MIRRAVRHWITMHRNTATHYAIDCPCRRCTRFRRWLDDRKRTQQ